MTDDIDLSQNKPRRVLDRSTQEASRAVGATTAKIGPWRDRLCQMSVMASRKPSDEQRAMMMAECGSIRRLVAGTREEFEVVVAALPARAAANSRVADIRKALDNVSSAIDGIVDHLLARPSGRALDADIRSHCEGANDDRHL